MLKAEVLEIGQVLILYQRYPEEFCFSEEKCATILAFKLLKAAIVKTKKIKFCLISFYFDERIKGILHRAPLKPQYTEMLKT